MNLIRKRSAAGQVEQTSRYGRRWSDHQPNGGWKVALFIGLTVTFLDWTTKALIVRTMPVQSFQVIVPDTLAFWHLRNPAMILGLWSSLPLAARQVIAVLSGVVAAVLLVEILGRGQRLPPRQQRFVWVFVGLASGGMAGNLGERALHWGVTDFISLRWGEIWLPPGNIADIALFISIPLSFVVIGLEARARSKRRPSASRGAGIQERIRVGIHD